MSSIVKVDTIQENTSANGITVDGLNIKDSKLVTANSVVTANITDANITAAKLGADATNAPAFEAKRSGTQTIANDTNVKIAPNVEVFDTAGAYDHSTNYRFTPQTAGKYYIYGQAVVSIAQEQLKRFSLFIRKNGNDEKYMSNYFTGNPAYINNIYIGAVIDFNGSSDYVELFAKIEYASSGTVKIDGGVSGPTFGAYRMGA